MSSGPGLHRFAHEAMSTVFETLIAGETEEYARQVSAEISREIERLESLLNRFDPSSDVARIGRLEPGGRLPISAETWECLAIAAQIQGETKGAFDVTVGSLMECIRDADGNPVTSTEEEREAARTRVGARRLILSRKGEREPDGDGSVTEPAYSVAVEPGDSETAGEGVVVDLGGIGKGYTLDRLLDILRDWGIESALIHAGTSTAIATASGGEEAGCPPLSYGWPVNVGGKWGDAAGLGDLLLRDQAVSGSGTEVKGAHVLDPRTGDPARGHAAAWVIAPSAAVADALSTAFLVMSTVEVEDLCARHSEVSAVLAEGPEGDERVRLVGGWERDG
jgi:thiamine biosynthesis lipoprotein